MTIASSSSSKAARSDLRVGCSSVSSSGSAKSLGLRATRTTESSSSAASIAVSQTWVSTAPRPSFGIGSRRWATHSAIFPARFGGSTIRTPSGHRCLEATAVGRDRLLFGRQLGQLQAEGAGLVAVLSKELGNRLKAFGELTDQLLDDDRGDPDLVRVGAGCSEKRLGAGGAA